MNWTELERLRSRFLAESFSAVSHYWTSSELIEQYDSTFAERIGWKWDAVFSELKQRAWAPPAGKFQVLDWGCGTGIAIRRFVEALAPEQRSQIDSLYLYDKSAECVQFACDKLRKYHPELATEKWPETLKPELPLVLLLSHVLNELEPKGLLEVQKLCSVATQILWVEPGSLEVSRKLIQQREALLAEFNVLAPCTHQKACGMLSPENERHWCHHFASPSSAVFQDSFWSEFSRRLKIDLRSLPVSFLVLEKKISSVDTQATIGAVERARIIGRPRLYKGNGKFLLCQAEGVRDTLLLEKTHKALFKSYKREQFFSLI